MFTINKRNQKSPVGGIGDAIKQETSKLLEGTGHTSIGSLLLSQVDLNLDNLKYMLDEVRNAGLDVTIDDHSVGEGADVVSSLLTHIHTFFASRNTQTLLSDGALLLTAAKIDWKALGVQVSTLWKALVSLVLHDSEVDTASKHEMFIVALKLLISKDLEEETARRCGKILIKHLQTLKS